jgi:uncharacterized protein
MENPFYYYRIVQGKDFADRTQELKELHQAVLNKERIFLVSPRRFGKSSLLTVLLDSLKQKSVMTLYFDLSTVASFRSLLEKYASETLKSTESSIGMVIKHVKELFPRLRPKITIEQDQTPSLVLDVANSDKDLVTNAEEILNAPEVTAQRKKKLFVVVLDEFQEILQFNGLNLEKVLRAAIQKHEHVSYIFAGSQKSLLYDMVIKPGRPFYKMGKIFNLGKLPRTEFREFLAGKFRSTSFKITDALLDQILDAVEDYPYNAQFLCHELWNYKRESQNINSEDVAYCLDKITGSFTHIYTQIIEALSLKQKNLLRAIVQSSTQNLYSEEFRRANNLGAASTVSISAKLLMKKELLDVENKKYFIPDVFLKEWIKRNLT